MKRIWILLAAAALLMTACGRQDMHPEWDEDWTRFEDILAAETPEGWILSEYNPTLSLSGIWYATWSFGQERMVQNTDGEDALAYDAQIYLLVKESGSGEEAEQNVADWTAREAQNYGTDETGERSVGGQSYTLLTLDSARADNPYSHGAAAFAVRGELAVSVEVLCAEGFEGDAQAILEQFLAGIHYGD